MRATEWMARAACRFEAPEIFFPTAEDGPALVAQVALAKSICARCVVRVECLDEAQARIPYGIAGGLTPEERRVPRPRRDEIEPVAALDDGLRTDATRSQIQAAGRVLLAAGRSQQEVARRCGVSARTVARWANQFTDTSTRRGVA